MNRKNKAEENCLPIYDFNSVFPSYMVAKLPIGIFYRNDNLQYNNLIMVTRLCLKSLRTSGVYREPPSSMG